MQLLISVTDAKEARAALTGGADIVDVKNPAEGALGAANVQALHNIRSSLPPSQPLSVALGETDTPRGVLTLAAYGAAAMGAQYVKVGLRMADPDQAITLLRAVRSAAQLASPTCRVIAVGYADSERVGALPWQVLPEMARAARIDGCLIDTAIKDGRTLFDFCDPADLAAWIQTCRSARLQCALAGTLRLIDAPLVRELRPDVVGFRSAACRGDRVNGRVEADLVVELRATLGL